MATKKEYALHYFDHGLIPIPLCWVKEGKCDCFKHHTDSKQIGKAPLVSYKDLEITRKTVEKWFTTFPLANIGILIQQSGMVIVDADSEDAVNEFESNHDAMIIPTVKTGRGKHYYFKAETTTPIYRITHTGENKAIDIFSNGYIVAPPSIHMNGYQYTWSNPPKKTGMPTVPKEIESMLVHKENEEPEAMPTIKELKQVNLDELPLNDFIKGLIREGEKSPYYRERGYQSRSHAIFGIIIACIKSGLTDDEIKSIIYNPKHAISDKIFRQKKSLDWLTKEIKRAKHRVVFPKTTNKNKVHSKGLYQHD